MQIYIVSFSVSKKSFNLGNYVLWNTVLKTKLRKSAVHTTKSIISEFLVRGSKPKAKCGLHTSIIRNLIFVISFKYFFFLKPIYLHFLCPTIKRIKQKFIRTIRGIKDIQMYLRCTFLGVSWCKGSHLKDKNLSNKINLNLIFEKNSYAVELSLKKRFTSYLLILWASEESRKLWGKAVVKWQKFVRNTTQKINKKIIFFRIFSC